VLGGEVRRLAFGFVIDDEVDVALAVQRDVLRAMQRNLIDRAARVCNML